MHPIPREFYQFIGDVLNNANTPGILLNIVIGLITIMVSVIIFIFSNDKQNQEVYEWEKVILLDKVLLVKILIKTYLILFGAVLLWDQSNIFFRVVYLFLFIYGVGIHTLVLGYTYDWFKTIEVGDGIHEDSFRNKLRLKYLGEITDKIEKEKVWSITWKKTNANILTERTLIEKFTLNLEQLLAEGDYEYFAKYLSIFVANIDNRILKDWIIFDNLFSKILNFRHVIYRNPTDLFTDKYLLSRVLRKLVEDGLTKGISYPLFDSLKKEIPTYTHDYVKEFLPREFCFIFFDRIDSSPEKYEIWDMYFDKNWFVTETNLNIDDSISKIWLSCYWTWAQPLFWKNEFDPNLTEVTEHLFPDVYPPIFSKVLTFITRPWSDDRFKSLISSPPIMLSPRIFSGSFNNIEDMDQAMAERDERQKVDTIKLLLKIFAGILTRNNLNSFIRSLNDTLPDEKKPEQELLKREYLEIFNALLATLPPEPTQTS